MPGTMNAVVMHAPGGPDVLQLEIRPNRTRARC
jgi:hypothetical protein